VELRCGLLHFGGGKRKGREEGGGEDGLLLNPLVGMFVVFGPVYPRVWFARFSGRKSFPRGDAYSVDHAGFEVEEIRARYVHAARNPVVKHVDEVELRVVVAAVLTVAPDAVLVAQHLRNRGAHMVTAPARQYMNSLARRTGPPACAKSRAKKQPEGGEHTGERGEKGGGRSE